MRVHIQRVSEAHVKIEGKIHAGIEEGLLLLLGIEAADDSTDIEWLTSKIVSMRIFADEKGLMNKSILDINGNILLISQFTLFGSTKKGNRPSFIRSAKPDVAIPLYEAFIENLKKKMGKTVQTGIFGADMKVSLVNDGPVTLLIDSKTRE